jgi:hypothetical protein
VAVKKTIIRKVFINTLKLVSLKNKGKDQSPNGQDQ